MTKKISRRDALKVGTMGILGGLDWDSRVRRSRRSRLAIEASEVHHLGVDWTSGL